MRFSPWNLLFKQCKSWTLMNVNIKPSVNEFCSNLSKYLKISYISDNFICLVCSRPAQEKWNKWNLHVTTKSKRKGEIYHFISAHTSWTIMKMSAWSLATRNWNFNLNHQRSGGKFARSKNAALHSVQWAKAKPSWEIKK